MIDRRNGGWVVVAVFVGAPILFGVWRDAARVTASFVGELFVVLGLLVIVIGPAAIWPKDDRWPLWPVILLSAAAIIVYFAVMAAPFDFARSLRFSGGS